MSRPLGRRAGRLASARPETLSTESGLGVIQPGGASLLCRTGASRCPHQLMQPSAPSAREPEAQGVRRAGARAADLVMGRHPGGALPGPSGVSSPHPGLGAPRCS